MRTLYSADLMYTDGAFQQGYAMCVNNGEIEAIGPQENMSRLYSHVPLVSMDGKAIMPGTVNAHNHSFQSLLRGIAADQPF